jgi:hypothetical protein
MSEENPNAATFLNEQLENIIKIFPYLKAFGKEADKIMRTVPDLLQTSYDPTSIKYTYNMTELIILIISIVIINQYKHDTIFNQSTVEGAFTTFFLILIGINVFHTTYLYLNDGKDLTGLLSYIKWLIHTVPLYIIVFLFSLILWFITNIFGWLAKLYYGILKLLDNAYTLLLAILSDKTESKLLYKYGGMYAVIFIVLILLYYAAFDPKALTTKAFTYTLSIIIPLIVIFFIVNPFANKMGSATNMLVMGLLALFFVAAFYFYSQANSQMFAVVNYVILILGILIVLMGLAIFFYIMSNYLKSLSGWTGFAVYFIFYIPCLLIDFIRYVLNEFKMTANPIFVLLIVEIALVVLYLYLPDILHFLQKTRNTELLPGSAFLDIKQTIGNSEMNKLPAFLKKVNEDALPVYNQNYAFSMWTFLNPQGANYSGYSGETQIFNYGQGKPRVTHLLDTEKRREVYRVYFTDSSSQKGYYEFSMPTQKWNNLVMNFTSTQADLFVNGQLEKTYIFDGNPPKYSPTDFVDIGQDKGLDGAICNVVYYPRNLSLIEIANNYNLLSIRNPPTYK